MDDYKKGYAATIAPLVVKDKVIVGVAGGEYGSAGFIDAYDAQTRQAGLALLHRSRVLESRAANLGRRLGRPAARACGPPAPTIPT